jgi:hypothetical protein
MKFSPDKKNVKRDDLKLVLTVTSSNRENKINSCCCTKEPTVQSTTTLPYLTTLSKIKAKKLHPQCKIEPKEAELRNDTSDSTENRKKKIYTLSVRIPISLDKQNVERGETPYIKLLEPRENETNSCCTSTKSPPVQSTALP